MERDTLMIGGVEFNSRFILSSGKTGHYTNELIHSAIDDAGVEMISVALSHLNEEDNGLKQAPEGIKFLPTTLGARTLGDVIKMAHLSKDRGLGDFIKVEILHDLKYELPDNDATVEATRILTEEGFKVLSYFYPDMVLAEELVKAGAVAIMPLASPSGSSKGLQTRDFIAAMVGRFDVPIIVDAGIGRPSQACEAMEIGCDGIMANTALATADNLPMMAKAFRNAIDAGRLAYLSRK